MKGLEEAEKALAGFFDAASADAEARPAPGVLEALADDLNTPQAIAEMHALTNAAGRKALAGTLAFFGFRASAFSEWREARAPAPALAAGGDRPPHRGPARCPQGEELRRGRPHPRRARRAGRVLKDSKDGTTWELAR